MPSAALRSDACVIPADRPLEGRVAVVTGSTRGAGLCAAAALAREGAHLMLNGFGDPAQIEPIRERLAAEHEVEVAYCGADLSDAAAIAGMMGFARDALGPIDILVNSAGVGRLAPVAAYPAAQWDAILAANLSSAFHTIRAVLPEMTARGWGRIINVTSGHGLTASPFRSAHAAAQHGVVGLTRSVAAEAAETGVTCNAICPGYASGPEQPAGRFAMAEAIGALTAFLCSERARSITGAALAVEGGWTADA